MVKKINSDYLENLLWHIQKGLIVGVENSSGPASVTQLEKKLEDILSGQTSIDEALEIVELPKGRPSKPHTKTIAAAVYRGRLLNYTWEAIEVGVKPWFDVIGDNPPKRKRIEQIHKSHTQIIESWISNLKLTHSLETNGFVDEKMLPDVEYIERELKKLNHGQLLLF